MRKFYTFVAAVVASVMSYTATAQNELVVGDVKVGDLITLSDSSQWYVGTNEITNGSFDAKPSENGNNILGWTTGSYAQMTTSNFNWIEKGGYDGGAYIQASDHSGSNGNHSICQRWSIQTGTRYYFSFYLSHNSENNQYIPVVTLTSAESTGGGQNEKLSEGAKQLIGKNGEDVGEILGYGGYKDEDGDGYGDWCQTACSFVSEKYTYLQFNARWLKENKIQACFDGFFLAKLYDPATTSQSTVAYLALQSAIENLQAQGDDFADYEGLASEIGDFALNTEVNGTIIDEMSEDTPLEDLQAAIEAVEKEAENIKAALINIEQFNTLLDQAAEMINSETQYPGIDAFNTAYSKYDDYKNNGFSAPSADVTASEYIPTAIAGLKQAIADYRMSQVATPESPADYTFFIDQPSFASQGAWYIGSTGGDQRVKSDATDNDGNTISCWNAWRNSASFTDNTVQQDLTDLPNGYYTVTADLNTQAGCITDQHIFATSSTATTVSPVLTQAGWDPMIWETLTTEKIIVVDGKLKVGATSNGSADIPDGFTDYRGGWFCVTNFKLNYLGEATAEDYAAAIATKFAAAEAQADTMHLAADKATFLAAIAKAKVDSNLDSLNAAVTIAAASETEYANVMAGSYANLQDSIKTAYTEAQAAIAQVPVDYMTKYLASADASYKNTGAITTVLRYYRDTLLPAVKSAEASKDEVASEEGKAVIDATIASVTKNLAAYTDSTEYLAAQVEALAKAVSLAKASDVAYGEGTDVTAYIMNPTCANTGSKVVPTGWTINMENSGNNYYANVGQNYDGDASAYYLDAWNGTAALLKYNVYQTLNIPNGTYQLSAYMRTTGEGFYLYAMTSDSTFAKSEAAIAAVNNTKYVDASIVTETGADSITYDTDTHGELWLAACDEVMAALGVTASTGFSIYDAALDANNGSEECPANVSEDSWNILKANSGKGRGWMKRTVEVEVKDHVLTVGVATGDALKDANTFTGTWLSATNFTLKMLSVGDNTNWNITTGVANVEAADSSVNAIYTISGTRANTLQKGINIVKMSNGTVRKVMVK